MPGMHWSEKEIEILEKHMRANINTPGTSWLYDIIDELKLHGYTRSIGAIRNRLIVSYGFYIIREYPRTTTIIGELIKQYPRDNSNDEKLRDYIKRILVLAKQQLDVEGVCYEEKSLINSIRSCEYTMRCPKKTARKKCFRLVENNTSPFRKYNQGHVDTAHWMYARYAAMYPREKRERIIELVSNDMNFLPERMEQILSYPPRRVVGE